MAQKYTEAREVIKAHAAARGESVNGFISRAINEAMERDRSALSMGINLATGEKLDKEG